MSAQVPKRSKPSRPVPVQLTLLLPAPSPKVEITASTALDAAAAPVGNTIVTFADQQSDGDRGPTDDCTVSRSPRRPKLAKLNEAGRCDNPAPPATPRPTNLAEVFLRLDSQTSLAKAKRQAMKSALKTVGRVIGHPLREITTEAAGLRLQLQNANPATALVSLQRWTHARSLLLAALRAFGLQILPGRSTGPLSRAWQSLFDLLPDERCKRGLSRLLHYCSREEIEPDQFDESVFPKFHEALIKSSLRDHGLATFNMTTRCWNRAASAVSGWPAVAADARPDTRKYALDSAAFPPSFLDDVDRFLANAGDQNPFAPDYVPSVAASTLEQRRMGIMQVATGLVASGMAADRVTSLAVLVNPINAEAALRWLLNRNDGTVTRYLAQQAQILAIIAKYWIKADDRVVKKLKEFKSNLALPRQGMTARNRSRLRQFDLEENVGALLNLPKAVLADVLKHDSGKRDDALRVMFAIAVEILIGAPLRVANLCALDLERHFVETNRGRHRTRHIVIPASETKNGFAFEKVLSDRTCRLLDQFVTTYRQRVSAAPGSVLFPGRDGGLRATTRFSTALSDFIFRETGIRMHAHLFRHFAGKIKLEDDPTDMETVRLILGHKTRATTERSYVELRNDQALQRYEETILKRLVQTEKQNLVGRKRRKSGARS
jgi:integrase